jgi:hypothetical protein
MSRCLELSDDCGGVTWSHKYWGDKKSTGPFRGYGYQLRKFGVGDILVDSGNRNFEASWVLRENALTTGCVKYTECHVKCKACGNSGVCTECMDGHYVNN